MEFDVLALALLGSRSDSLLRLLVCVIGVAHWCSRRVSVRNHEASHRTPPAAIRFEFDRKPAGMQPTTRCYAPPARPTLPGPSCLPPTSTRSSSRVHTRP